MAELQPETVVATAQPPLDNHDTSMQEEEPEPGYIHDLTTNAERVKDKLKRLQKVNHDEKNDMQRDNKVPGHTIPGNLLTLPVNSTQPKSQISAVLRDRHISVDPSLDATEVFIANTLFPTNEAATEKILQDIVEKYTAIDYTEDIAQTDIRASEEQVKLVLDKVAKNQTKLPAASDLIYLDEYRQVKQSNRVLPLEIDAKPQKETNIPEVELPQAA